MYCYLCNRKWVVILSECRRCQNLCGLCCINNDGTCKRCSTSISPIGCPPIEHILEGEIVEAQEVASGDRVGAIESSLEGELEGMPAGSEAVESEILPHTKPDTKLSKRWSCELCGKKTSDIYRHLKGDKHKLLTGSLEYKQMLLKCELSSMPAVKKASATSMRKTIYCSYCKEYITSSFAAHCRSEHGYSQGSSEKAVYLNRGAVESHSGQDVQSGGTTKKDVKGKARKCIVCQKVVVNIYQHLRSHSNIDYKVVLKNCPASESPPKMLNPNTRFHCPVKGCWSVVNKASLQKHLKHHDLSHEQLKFYTINSEIFDNSDLNDISPSRRYVASKKVSVQSTTCGTQLLAQFEDAVIPVHTITEQSTTGGSELLADSGDDLGVIPINTITEQSTTSGSELLAESGDDDQCVTIIPPIQHSSLGISPHVIITLEDESRCLSFLHNDHQNDDEADITTDVCKEGEYNVDSDIDLVIDGEQQSDIDIIEKEYEDWMKCVFAGNTKKDKDAQCEARNLARHFQALDVSDIRCLFSESYFQSKFSKYHKLKNKEGKVKNNSTMATYVQCLIGFVNYVLERKKFKDWGVKLEDVMTFSKSLQRLKSSFQKLRSGDDRVREEEEQEKLSTYLTDDTVSNYISVNREKCDKLLLEYSDHPERSLNRTDYCFLRDYFITLLEFRTAHRDGVIPHLLIELFKKGIWNEKNEYQVRVREHKTFKSSGSAHICFPKDLFKRVNLFLECIRSKFPNTKNKYLFPPWSRNDESSNPMQSGSTSRVITKQLQNTDIIPKDVKISATNTRQKACTKMRNLYPGMQDQIALSMKHNTETASRFYVRMDAVANAHVVQGMLGQYWGIDENTSNNDSDSDGDRNQVRNEESSGGIDNQSTPVFSGSIDNPSTPVRSDRNDGSIDNPSTPVRSDRNDVGNDMYHNWDGEDESKLEEHFKDKSKWTNREIFEKEFKVFAGTLNSCISPQKAYQKLFRIFSPKRKRISVNLPSPLISKRTKKESCFTTPEKELLYQKCGKYILGKKPKKKIMEALQGTILEKFEYSKVQSCLQYWSVQMKKSNVNSEKLPTSQVEQ